MGADPSVTSMLTRARDGDKQAWDALVERYAPLVWSICGCYRLSRADAKGVGQSVWLHLVDQLGTIEDPAALAGWLITTTRRECGRVQRPARRSYESEQALDSGQALDVESSPSNQAQATTRALLVAERQAALREAFACLPGPCQRLLTLLTDTPPASDARISAELGIPVESIELLRNRCLQRLRSHPAVAGIINAETGIVIRRMRSQDSVPPRLTCQTPLCHRDLHGD